MAILAAGVGFAIRGGIFDNWGSEFGFTGTQLGDIGGAGFTGFCFGIIIGGVLADKIGYGKLVVAAFAFHVISAFVTFAANPGQDQQTAFNFLKWGMFIFALANGTLEAVANPLVATLFPNNRTHYLNILHASWPAGLVLGAAVGWILDEGMHLSWKVQLALYLIPTVLYGIMFFGQHFPKSEASAKGVKFWDMFKDVGILGGLVVCYLVALFFSAQLGLPKLWAYLIGGGLLLVIGVMTRFSLGAILLFVLFITHALVGAVELGTDQWMQNITGNILSPGQGKLLFIWTSLVMFGLRFCAHFIEKNLKLSPIGILFVCAVLACVGLNLTSMAQGFAMAFLALTVYGIGKTFFWPTMLAVASDRFPRTGAVAISLMGGIGMMSAGLIGSPGLGYAKDRFAGEELKKEDAALYDAYKADKGSKFTIFDEVVGLDGKKLGEAKGAETKTPEQQKVVDADIRGDRRTLVADSFIPATMAVIYLLLLLAFKAMGGYKPVQITREQIAGGVEGPMEA
ncbi:MAG: MFS transporter [Verrucomicrobiae bacterium]|nr:MFS transporter [Verrucomicrobiae bacterium]